MTKARLSPESGFRDAESFALREGPGADWQVTLSLPNPKGAVNWEVRVEEHQQLAQRQEKGRAHFTWTVTRERWKDARPFKASIRTDGYAESITISHPTRETTLSDGATWALLLIQPYPVPR